MKYMGSKKAMLENGLGVLIREEARSRSRVVDLFSGSGSVAWFAAQNLDIPVLATDLQLYAAHLARAVVGRTKAEGGLAIEAEWLCRARSRLLQSSSYLLALDMEDKQRSVAAWVSRSRALCASVRGSGPIWRAYGGYYFSPSQAAIFDTLLRVLPRKGAKRWICQAALLVAASRCAASPGHTAQPFSSSESSAPFLLEAWKKDPLVAVAKSIRDLSRRFAKRQGSARVASALRMAHALNDGDLVFLDPPYSGVHYSRFYHVLETIARRGCGRVEGTGRYPVLSERPSSHFSQKSLAQSALDKLLRSLALRRCAAILTFPVHDCSNGLSGKIVEQIARESFVVSRRLVETRFSTLGGNGRNRGARKRVGELILVLRPK